MKTIYGLELPKNVCDILKLEKINPFFLKVKKEIHLGFFEKMHLNAFEHDYHELERNAFISLAKEMREIVENKRNDHYAFTIHYDLDIDCGIDEVMVLGNDDFTIFHVEYNLKPKWRESPLKFPIGLTHEVRVYQNYGHDMMRQIVNMACPKKCVYYTTNYYLKRDYDGKPPIIGDDNFERYVTDGHFKHISNVYYIPGLQLSRDEMYGHRYKLIAYDKEFLNLIVNMYIPSQMKFNKMLNENYDS